MSRRHLVMKSGAVAAVLLAACSEDRRGYSPTAPSFPSLPVSSVVTWSGSWTVDQVTPAGDCLADALNAFRYGLQNWPLELDVEQDGSFIRLRFWHAPGNDDSEGFWPLEFTGTVAPDGTVLASVPSAWLGARRTDPWLELCYWEWSMQGGQLSASLSADGRRVTGTILESFRVSSNGTTFTVHSHFEAVTR